MRTARGASAAPGASAVKAGDSRSAKRQKSRLLVRYGTTVLEKTAFTKNISEAGLYIHTNQVYRPGTMIQLLVQFPDRAFSFWGRVVWARQVPPQLAHLLECGMGICFVEPPPDWRAYHERWKRKFDPD